MSERNAALWEDPAFRAKAIARLRESWRQRGGRTAEDRARIGERSRRMWADPSFRARMGRQIALGWENRRERLRLLAAPDRHGAQPGAGGGAAG
jgi:hypothetical protein